MAKLSASLAASVSSGTSKKSLLIIFRRATPVLGNLSLAYTYSCTYSHSTRLHYPNFVS